MYAYFKFFIPTHDNSYSQKNTYIYYFVCIRVSFLLSHKITHALRVLHTHTHISLLFLH